jgi:hypothetical protein
MECNFHIGQKVVCVNDDPAFHNPAPGKLTYRDMRIHKGQIYTIKGFTDRGGDNIYISLDEEPIHVWYHRRFRPLKSQDLGILNQILARPENFTNKLYRKKKSERNTEYI